MQIHNVNRPKGHNRFCGPAVISALTKMTTNDAAALIRQRFGKKCVMGTQDHEVLDILTACGIKHKPGPGPRNVTLAAWLKATINERTPGRVFLIVAGHHWQLVSGRRYVCGRLPTGEVVSIKHELVKRRAKVARVWELVSDKVAPVKPTIVKRKADPDAKDRAEAKRLAKQHGIEIEKGRGDWLIKVYPPEGVSAKQDPYEFDHSHDRWCEALMAVRTYAEMVCR